MGLQTGNWDTSKIDIVCDIASIPEPDCSFDAILCSEVLEHIPNPVKAVEEFRRLLKPGGVMILTAPFASQVHFSPYHFCTGFSKYWYEHHLSKNRFVIEELVPNGDWFDFFYVEIARLPYVSRKYKERLRPLAFLLSVAGLLFFKIRGRRKPVAHDICCLGWHCVARKKE
jgi:SAM-dependent methyltransferase